MSQNIPHGGYTGDMSYLEKPSVVSKVTASLSKWLKSCNSGRFYIMIIVSGEQKISLVGCHKYGKILTKKVAFSG